ncbi:MAG: DUF3616 domain-containing protein [Pseudomonadota bacterium]
MRFDAKGADAPFRDLSAGARIGDTLFVAGDEGAAIERLSPGPRKTWVQTESYRLAKLIDLPSGSDSEIDIEGMAIVDGWLWVTGSHALTRPRPDGDGPSALRDLSELKRGANRYLLARFPLVDEGKGQFGIAADAGDREAGRVDAGKRSSTLIKWIEDDSLLAPFLALPAKENGFDVEGLAAHGHTVWLGLRGPVVRGHAVVLHFEMRTRRNGLLRARKTAGGRRYHKHLLDLDGLGVRDLLADGEDLLILAGPPMTTGDDFRIIRWSDAETASESMVVPRDALKAETRLPPPGRDLGRPEAIIAWAPGQILVLRDSAPVAKRGKTRTVTAELVEISG